MDIFGRMPDDYEHLRDLQKDGGNVEEYLRANAAVHGTSMPPHNFNALQSGLQVAFEGQAQVVGFSTNNLQAIQSMIDEILYVDYRLPEYIPIITNVPEGAETYAYRVVDKVGRGRFIDFDGNMAPTAKAGQRLVAYPLEYAGIIPQWSIEDLRRCMFAGMSLDTEVIEAATTGAMDHIEQVGLLGDEARGFHGLTAFPNSLDGADPEKVHRSVLLDAGKQLVEMTGDEMVRFLQKRALEIITSTKEVFGRNIRSNLCFYMPLDEAALVTETRMATGTDTTVWDYFMAHNSWKKYTGRSPMLKWLAELDTAGVKADNATPTTRMIVACNDTKIMEMAMPISPRAITMLDMGYTVQSPMEYKISGLNLKRPAGVRYIDNI